MPLYQLTQNQSVTQIKPASFQNERELQHLFEKSLESLMEVRFNASEISTEDRPEVKATLEYKVDNAVDK